MMREKNEKRKKYFEYMKNEMAGLQAELWYIISYYDIDDYIEEAKLGEFINDIVCVKNDKTSTVYFLITQKFNMYLRIFELIKEKTKIDYEYQYEVPEEFLVRKEE